MTTYLQQKWVLKQCDLEQFAEDQGFTSEDMDSGVNGWDLFGDGMDAHAEFDRAGIARFSDDILRQLFNTMFEENPHVESIFIVR